MRGAMGLPDTYVQMAGESKMQERIATYTYMGTLDATISLFPY